MYVKRNSVSEYLGNHYFTATGQKAPFCIFRVIFKLGKRLVFHRRRGFECGSYKRIESLGHWL